METFSRLNVEVADHIARIELNRPDKANALNGVLWQEIGRVFEWADRSSEVRVAVLSGVGNYFSAGIDFELVQSIVAEVGRLELDDQFFDVLAQDGRFVVDEPPLASLIAAAMPLTWTRDPFDRLLVAHSLHRRTPLCSVDRTVRAHHKLMAKELRA